jgi:hypothetical protein
MPAKAQTPHNTIARGRGYGGRREIEGEINAHRCTELSFVDLIFSRRPHGSAIELSVHRIATYDIYSSKNDDPGSSV